MNAPAQFTVEHFGDRLESLLARSCDREAHHLANKALDVEACRRDFRVVFLAATTASRTGRVLEAEDLFASAFALSPIEAAYALGSCLAARGAWDAAIALFRENVSVRTGAGTATLTCSLVPGFGQRVEGIRHDLSLWQPARLLGPGGVTRRAVYLVACDDRYFQRFAWSLVHTASWHAPDISLHFHVVNPGGVVRRTALALAERTGVGVSFGELIHPGLDDASLWILYACMRFLVLPRLLAEGHTPCLVADIDQVLLGPPAPLLALLRRHDVALLRFPQQRHNILSYYSATIAVFGATPASLQMAASCEAQVRDAMLFPSRLQWHLDQAILAYVAGTTHALRIADIPPGRVCLDGSLRVGKKALLWSVTGSIPENASRVPAELL